jgi:hypothetical protein
MRASDIVMTGMTTNTINCDVRVRALSEVTDMVVPAAVIAPIRVVGDQIGVIDTLVDANVHPRAGTKRTNCTIGSARRMGTIVEITVSANVAHLQ